MSTFLLLCSLEVRFNEKKIFKYVNPVLVCMQCTIENAMGCIKIIQFTALLIYTHTVENLYQYTSLTQKYY